MKPLALAFTFWLATSSGLFALSCERVTHHDQSYTHCSVDISDDEIGLYLKNDEGDILGSLTRLRDHLADQGQTVLMALNAGMYHEGGAPVGYFQTGESIEAPLLTGASTGNFGLLPNGVFCKTNDIFIIRESRNFAQNTPNCQFATQSGPMLVIDGELHPRFLKDSTSRYIRNGVGVSEDGRKAHFVISKSRVTFHEFGSFFKDALALSDALYFDGSVSQLYVKDGPSQGFPYRIGPMIAVTTRE